MVIEPETFRAAAPPRRRSARSPRRHARGTPGPGPWIGVIVGGIGLVTAATGLVVSLAPWRLDATQQRRLASRSITQRWRTLPAGAMFPASVDYELSATDLDDVTGLTLTARRVGIAPQASCPAAVDPAAARILDARGCQAVLRADYVDASGTFVVTVGVAVLPGARAAAAAQASLAAVGGTGGLRPGVRPVRFAGTLAAGFGERQRQIVATTAAGPYLVMYTAGYTDGRPREPMTDDRYAEAEMTSAAQGVADAVAHRMTAPPTPSHCPGAPGC